MKKSLRPRSIAAFTLVELLTVIAVIAVLASLLLPAIGRAKTKARIASSRSQMSDISRAVAAYREGYSRLPSTQAAAGNGVPDFTFGSTGTGTLNILNNGGAYEANNNELVAILGNLTTFASGAATVNAGYARNPKRLAYLDFKPSSGDASAPRPEVGRDGVYRDPWSQPYYVTVDMNYDGVCMDALYRLDVVSGGGAVGTFSPPPLVANTWRVRGEVMVWSSGPDGRFTNNTAALTGVNEDNILSWFTP